jgi:DNA invertase Pin-like site-specific DNA recombinase
MTRRTLPRKSRTLRAIIYVRVSSYDKKAGEAANQSPEVQTTRCTARVSAEGWQLATEVGDNGVIYDLDVSGSDRGERLNRPGLLLAREAIRTGKADVIVALRLDRLARNTVDLLTLAEELESHGGAFALAEGDINTAGPYGKLILTIIAAIAEMEARMITERTTAGRDAAREQGRWVGGRITPWGYVRTSHPTITDAWTLAPDPQATPIVAKVVELARGGASATAVARWLNDHGVVSQTGKRWYHVTVQDVFSHPAMVGRVYHQGDVLRDSAGLPRTVFPPLVDEAVWRELIAGLGEARRHRPGAPQPAPDPDRVPQRRKIADELLSGGVARCATCGGALAAAKDSYGDRRYRCYRAGRGACAHGVSVLIDALNDVVSGQVLTLIGGQPTSEMVEVVDPEGASRRTDIAEALKAAKAALADAIEDDNTDAEAAARTQVRELRAQLDAIPMSTVVRQRRWTGETYAQKWDRLVDEVAQRREMLSKLVTVQVAPAVRMANGQFDKSRQALEARVHVVWEEWALQMLSQPQDNPAPTSKGKPRASRPAKTMVAPKQATRPAPRR